VAKQLTEYLSSEVLQQLQDAFTAGAQVPIRIFDAGGEPLTKESDLRMDEGSILCPDATGTVASGEDLQRLCDVPVRLEDEVLGSIRVFPSNDAATGGPASAEAGTVRAGTLRFVRLMAMMIARFCDREKQLRSRVSELAALFELTGEFSGPRDLQSVLDLVARTVVKALSAKSCSIRLLNEDRTELVAFSAANLTPEYLGKGPILVSESRIDREVLETGQPLYIADEATDPRVLYPDQARQEGIVSALCAPLVYKNHPEGVLHVYTGQPHEFDWFEVSLLQSIAAQAAAAIVNARLYEEAVKGAARKRQLQLARGVQRRMIPSGPPKVLGLDIAAVYVPTFELSGDFYDFLDLPPDNLGIAISDVVGKGVRASLLMASTRASLRAHALNIYDMSKVLGMVNRDLCADTLSSDFATLFYGVLDVKTHRLTYANAGHPPPMLICEGKVRNLSTGGGVIGVDAEGRWHHEAVTLRSGDVILAYTDGLVEAMNFEDEPFGVQRAEQAAVFAVGQGQSADGIVKHVLWEMRRFAGLQTRLDDLTMVVVKVL